MAISFYDSTGKFTGTLSGDPGIVDATKSLTDSLWIDGLWDGSIYYVLNGSATERPVSPVQLSGQSLVDVPVPATVWINTTKYETNESRVELGFSQPGTYAVKVVAWPYLDKELTVENPA